MLISFTKNGAGNGHDYISGCGKREYKKDKKKNLFWKKTCAAGPSNKELNWCGLNGTNFFHQCAFWRRSMSILKIWKSKKMKIYKPKWTKSISNAKQGTRAF